MGPLAEFDDIPSILQKLERKEDRFPLAAVCAAISWRDEIVPDLLRILEHTADNLEAVSSDHGYFTPLYAMFLLAQFREPRAYPILIRLFSTPGEAVMDLAGDVVTEGLCSILASVAFGDMSGLASMAENPEVNEYVRSAALKAMVGLVVIGERTREEVMAYFASLFRGRLERQPEYIWTSLVSRCLSLYPEEVSNDIRQAYADELVESFVVWGDVERLAQMRIGATVLQNNKSIGARNNSASRFARAF